MPPIEHHEHGQDGGEDRPADEEVDHGGITLAGKRVRGSPGLRLASVPLAGSSHGSKYGISHR